LINKLYHWLEGNLLSSVIALSVVCIALLSPGDPEPGPDIPHLDKVVHVGLFFGLSTTWLMTFAHLWPHKTRIILLVVTGLGVGSEYAQLYIPYRTGGWQDFIADVIGIAIGMIVFVRRPKSQELQSDK